MYKRKAPSSLTKAYAKKKRVTGPGIAALKGRVARSNQGYQRTGGFYGRFPPSGSEQKFFDTAVSFTCDTTGEVPTSGQLVLIPQGVTESTRVGRKCVIKSILIHGVVITTYGAATSANSSGVTVVYVVVDKQTNGAAAAATDVFTGTNFANAVRNLSNSDRFTILKKFTHSWSPTAGVSAAFGDISKSISWYKKCNIPLEFSSTTGAITELKSNNIFLLAGASANIDDTVTFNVNCRVRFSDG